MPNWPEIIDRIYEACDPKDQKHLAQMLGIYPSVVSRWRSTKKDKAYPSMDVLIQVADQSGVTLDWLITGRKPKFRK